MNYIELWLQKRRIDIIYRRKFRIYCKEFIFFETKLKERLKNFKTCRVPYLGLDLSIFRRFFINLYRGAVPLK
jgi:hypothetical protein